MAKVPLRSILRYDINYYLTGGSVFENGTKTGKNSEITRNPESMIKNSQISLRSVRENLMGGKGSSIRNTVSVITEYTFNPKCTYLITTSTTCTANGATCKTVIVSITELSCTMPGEDQDGVVDQGAGPLAVASVVVDL